MSDLERGLVALASSKKAYLHAEAEYEGTVEEFFASAKIAKEVAKSGTSFRLNFAAIPVDQRIDRMEVASISVPQDETLTKILVAEFWEANDLDEDISDFFRKAGIFGDFFATVWEGDVDEEDGEAAVTSVEVFANSPLNTRIIYSRENSRRKLFGIRVWESDASTKDEPVWRINLSYRDRIEQWISKAGTKGASADDFEEMLDYEDDGTAIPDSWIIDNPYGEIPMFHFRQGGKPYGEPVHKRAWGAQDMVNKSNSTGMSTVEAAGFKQRWALMDGESEEDDTGDDWVDYETSGVQVGDPQNFETTALTTKKSKLKNGPGETWWLRGVTQVGEFDATDFKTFSETEIFAVRSMAILTGTPLYAFDLTGAVPSGESRRRADAPLVKSVETIARGHGQTIENMASFALAILGHAGKKVEVKFAPFSVASDKEDWDTIAVKLSSGVPLRTVLSEAGYSTEEIAEWYPEGTPALAPSTIVELAGAINGLSAGATLGVLAAEDVKLALPMLFPADDRLEGQ